MLDNNVTTAMRYPSARLKGMAEFIEFLREPGWKPQLINIALLKKLGIAKGKEGLVVQALQFLKIIDGKGVPTAAWDNLQSDYESTLRALVEREYADLLALIPASKVNQMRLVSYFGKPVETAEYQAKFFVWLCEQSHIALPNVEKRFHRARFDKPRKEP